jgi:hypothetical protein
MYTDDDLMSAVKAGVLDLATAERFQNHIAQSRDVVIADEERFRLVSSFNDIFVLIASVMLIFGVASFLGRAWGAFSCAALAWVLAEIFTKSRRMASPSIVYALVFSLAPAFGFVSLVDQFPQSVDGSKEFYVLAGACSILACCAALFWRRFQVSIAVTLICGALIAVAYSLLIATTGGPRALHVPFFLFAGLVTFGLAMKYDMKDVKRVTTDADIAFWLHLLAASLTVHTLFQLLEVIGQKGSLLSSAIAIGAFVAFALIALVIDRRATLVSAALYVVTALIANFRQFEISKDNSALSMLMVGACLLVLSWGWSPLRKLLLARLPSWLTVQVPTAN